MNVGDNDLIEFVYDMNVDSCSGVLSALMGE